MDLTHVFLRELGLNYHVRRMFEILCLKLYDHNMGFVQNFMHKMCINLHTFIQIACIKLLYIISCMITQKFHTFFIQLSYKIELTGK